MTLVQITQQYADVFSHLRVDNLDELLSYVSEDIHFRDPFNDVYSKEAMRHILLDMFNKTNSPKFVVIEQVVIESAAVGWLRWEFSAGLPVIGRVEVEGATRLSYDNTQQCITEHLDYWDSAPLYFQLPIIGRLLNRIRSRLSHNKN